MSTDSPRECLRKLHEQLGNMLDQIGHPDYSLRELADGLRQVRDVLFDLSETGGTDTREGRGSSLVGVLADGSPHSSTDAKPGDAAPGGAGLQLDDKPHRQELKRTRQQFDEIVGGEDGTPLERLRLFCSLGLNGDDWLDVEPFFDAVEKELSARSATGTPASVAFEAGYAACERGENFQAALQKAFGTADSGREK